MTQELTTIDPTQHKQYLDHLIERRAIIKSELTIIEEYLFEVGRLRRDKAQRREMVKQ